MAEARVPKIDTGRENEVVGGGGCRLDRIQCIPGAITSVEEHPSMTILHRKADIVKFHSYRVTSGKKPIGGAPFWHMRGAYGMRHQYHATNNRLLVAHLNMRHAYVEY
jgi:hypothetical protein